MKNFDTMRWPGRLPGSAAAAQAEAPQSDDLRTVRQGYGALVVVAAIVQVFFFWRTEDNLLSTALALASSLCGINYALNSRRFRTHPVSALILLLYTTTSCAAALMVKSLEWSALSDRLEVPILTFSVSLGAQLALMAAHHVYLRNPLLGAAREFLTERVVRPIGMLRWPSDFELWVLGLMGCVSVVMSGTDFESGASFGFASAGDKIIRLFGFLKFAPFLIPFRDALAGVPGRTRVPLLALVLFFCALVGISFATNSRSTFADAVPTVGLCVLIAIALGRFDFRRVPPAKLLMFVVGAMIASVLLSRVALAMVVVRDYRNNADVFTLVRMTVEALFSDEWLQAAKAKMDNVVATGNYSEEYVNSRFLARFILTKFHDNILYYFSLMGGDHIASYKGFMLDRLAATLPDPLLRPFGINIDKQDLIVSNGDYVVYLVDGWGLGGFKTGSMLGEVFSVYGWFSPLVMAMSALLLFVVHDAFVARTSPGRLAFSPFIMLLLWNLVGTTAAFGLGAETVTAIPAGIVRGLPQNMLVYVIAIVLVKGVTRLTGRSG